MIILVMISELSQQLFILQRKLFHDTGFSLCPNTVEPLNTFTFCQLVPTLMKIIEPLKTSTYNMMWWGDADMSTNV
jgi:hypothetical protein